MGWPPDVDDGSLVACSTVRNLRLRYISHLSLVWRVSAAGDLAAHGVTYYAIRQPVP